MYSKDLLAKITVLESLLSDYSYAELKGEEASELKNRFLAFKSSLEAKIFKQPEAVTQNQIDNLDGLPAKPGRNDTKSNINAAFLIAKVSHELRTPLNGIIGFTDILEEGKLSGKQKQQVKAIQAASHTLIEIVNELLEYSNLAAGTAHFEHTEFNVYNLLKDICYLGKTLITEKKVHFEIKIDPKVPKTLVGDPSKLTQVLLNLLGNAIKFVEEGDICLELDLKDQQGEQLFLEFSITDTGIGIAENQLAHIFDAFRQADTATASQYGGFGLGLCIVKQIIETLEGSISVSSQVGQGTTFQFTIPYQQQGSSKEFTTQSKKVLSRTMDMAPLKGMCILVFEDNPLNQKLIEQRLKLWGCRVEVTDDALYGLSVLESKRIDIVLMDLKMPNRNGFEVTELIRKSTVSHVRQLPIIALSADFSAQDMALCELHGINDFILKPYRPDELMNKLIKIHNAINSNMENTGSSKPLDPQDTRKHRLKTALASLLKDCMGELTLLEELMRLFKQNALEFIGASKIHISNTDFNNLKLAAHKIKSGVAMMKADTLLEIVLHIHDQCENDQDLAKLNILHKNFVEEFHLLDIEIEIAIHEIRNT